MDVINLRIADIRLTASEKEFSGIATERLRTEQERAKRFKTLKKCIMRLARIVKPFSPDRLEPSIGLLPIGKGNSKMAAERLISGCDLERVDQDEIGEKEAPPPAPMEDAEDPFYLCEKTTDELVGAEPEQVWEL
jgi:hypothetical protein